MRGPSLGREDPPVLPGPQEHITALLPTGRDEVKDIAIAIPHVNPLTARGRSPDRRDRPGPGVRLAGPLQAFSPRLAHGRGVPQERLLVGDPEHLTGGRHDRQHGLEQKALAAAIPDGSQRGGLGMLGVVHVRGILHEQHPGGLARGGLGVLPMRLHQSGKGDIVLIQQPIGRLQGRRVAHLLW